MSNSSKIAHFPVWRQVSLNSLTFSFVMRKILRFSLSFELKLPKRFSLLSKKRFYYFCGCFYLKHEVKNARK